MQRFPPVAISSSLLTPATFAAKYPQVRSFVGGWQGSLSNSGETLELVDDTGHVVDQLRYADEGDWSQRTEGPDDRGHRGWIWSAGHNGGNKSLELIQQNHSNDVGQNWNSSLLDGGTPGVANSVATRRHRSAGARCDTQPGSCQVVGTGNDHRAGLG